MGKQTVWANEENHIKKYFEIKQPAGYQKQISSTARGHSGAQVMKEQKQRGVSKYLSRIYQEQRDSEQKELYVFKQQKS